MQNKKKGELEGEAAQLLQRLARWSATEADMAAQRQAAALAVAESERLRRQALEQLKLKVNTRLLLSGLSVSVSISLLSPVGLLPVSSLLLA